MTQISGLWNGASVGDADLLTEVAADGIGYRLGNSDYESYFVDRFGRMIYNGDENRGVLKGWGNELAVTGVATPVAVDTGGAIVYGMPYENTVSVNVAVPSPTTDTRQDYIVLRRDWDAQTIRITRIVGVEGGGIPSITQSPAPSGSGIYDIPLATLSITTGGVITVTDAREFTLYGTQIASGALTATHLATDSVDFPDRATRTTSLFVGASDMEAILNAGRFNYGSTSWWSMTAAAAWDGAANESGWRLNGSVYMGAQGSVYFPPANYAGGTIYSYVWWVANAAIASTFYIRTAGQLQSIGTGPLTCVTYYPTYGNDYTNETLVLHSVYKSDGFTIPESRFTYGGLDTHLLTFAAIWYNAAGGEDIDLLGMEFQYTGYV